MNPSLRKLMAAIAAGLPIAIPVVTAPFNVGGCYPLGYQCPHELVADRIEHANDGALTAVECEVACGEDVACRVVDERQVECLRSVEMCPPAGRPPSGALAMRASPLPDAPLLAWLRDAALMEAASVGAFEELAEHLAAHGAPTPLIDAARVARDDEARHTAAMVRLIARRAGRARVRVEVRRESAGSLEALATANLVDGCIGEAWASVEAAHQARAAIDADVREAMSVIAREEAEHALLSMRIDAWARARLDAAALARLDATGAEARRRRREALAARADVPGLGLHADAPDAFERVIG